MSMTTTEARPPAQPDPTEHKNPVVDWLKGQYALYILVALLIIASISTPAFLTPTNLTNLLLQMSIIGVVVLAELIVVLTGGIDISVGSALGLAAVLAAGVFGGSSVLLALAVALVVRGAVGMGDGRRGSLPRPR